MIKTTFVLLLLISATSSQSCPQAPVIRVSEKKCEEYIDLLPSTPAPRGFSLLTFRSLHCKTNEQKSYNCSSIGTSGLIVGGVQAKPGEFPHMAAIGWRTPDGKVSFQCGGSLISERFILTAAHCSYQTEMGPPSFVLLGLQSLTKLNNQSSPVGRKIKRFIQHENFKPDTNKDDIALIELDIDVPFHYKYLRPACLQQTDYEGTNVTASGWGKLSTHGSTSDSLMKVTILVNTIDACEYFLENDELDQQTQICAGGINGKDTCQGDSGAPIQVSHPKIPCVYNLIGVTSFGSANCGTKAPAVYTKVSNYLDWIEGIVWPQL